MVATLNASTTALVVFFAGSPLTTCFVGARLLRRDKHNTDKAVHSGQRKKTTLPLITDSGVVPLGNFSDLVLFTPGTGSYDNWCYVGTPQTSPLMLAADAALSQSGLKLNFPTTGEIPQDEIESAFNTGPLHYSAPVTESNKWSKSQQPHFSLKVVNRSLNRQPTGNDEVRWYKVNINTCIENTQSQSSTDAKKQEAQAKWVYQIGSAGCDLYEACQDTETKGKTVCANYYGAENSTYWQGKGQMVPSGVITAFALLESMIKNSVGLYEGNPKSMQPKTWEDYLKKSDSYNLANHMNKGQQSPIYWSHAKTAKPSEPAASTAGSKKSMLHTATSAAKSAKSVAKVSKEQDLFSVDKLQDNLGLDKFITSEPVVDMIYSKIKAIAGKGEEIAVGNTLEYISHPEFGGFQRAVVQSLLEVDTSKLQEAGFHITKSKELSELMPWLDVLTEESVVAAAGVHLALKATLFKRHQYANATESQDSDDDKFAKILQELQDKLSDKAVNDNEALDRLALELWNDLEKCTDGVAKTKVFKASPFFTMYSNRFSSTDATAAKAYLQDVKRKSAK